jgi:dTDP-L-rhamnose 4-epimerase
LRLWAVYDLPTVCLRQFNLYGPRPSLSNPYTGGFAIFLSWLLSARSPTAYEMGRRGTFVSVRDTIEDRSVQADRQLRAHGQLSERLDSAGGGET